MDPNTIIELVKAHKYVALAAIVIGLVVRLLKNDTKLPINVPPAARKWVAIGLGGVYVVLDKSAMGADWTTAIVEGILAAALPIVGHHLLIDGGLGGSEIPIPFLMVPGASPSPGKAPTIPERASAPKPPAIPPGATQMLAALFGIVMAIVVAACTKAATVLDLGMEKAECVLANQGLPWTTIVEKCAIQPGDFEKYKKLLAASKAGAPVGACSHDGGARDAGSD